MSSPKKMEDLKKMALIELKDVLYRETQLLKNSKLINTLPDRGESIRKVREKVVQEIKHREDLQSLGESISKLSIGEKHIQKLCDIEKTPEKERYKPFSTLNKTKEIKPDSKVFKIIEDCTYTHKPTKLINLAESIVILKQQDEKVKDEQMRARYKRMFDKLEKDEESRESDSESESCKQYFEDEETDDEEN